MLQTLRWLKEHKKQVIIFTCQTREEQVMKLVRNQKGHVQDCAVVLIGVCEACCEKQAQENAH